MPPRLLTPDEAADRLQVSRRTLRRLVATGDLAVVRIGKVTRFTEAAIAGFIRRHEQGGQPQVFRYGGGPPRPTNGLSAPRIWDAPDPLP